MNDDKRRRLTGAAKLVRMASDIVDRVRSEEEDCVDNTPENLQCSIQYEDMCTVVQFLEDAGDGIDNVLFYIEEAIHT